MQEAEQKRRISHTDLASDNEPHSQSNSEAVDEEQGKTKVRTYKRQKTQITDAAEIDFTPVELNEEDDEQLLETVINDPLRGYFYYENLGYQLGTLLKTFVRKSGLHLPREKIQHVKYYSWEEFVRDYRFIPTDRERWRKIGGKIDIIEVANSIVKYRKMIVDLLNTIYLGYTKGMGAANERMSHQLILMASKCSKRYTKNLNLQYYRILSSEFKEFFSMTTGFGNDLNMRVKREPLYISSDDLNVDDISSALVWTETEKDIFYESLARYGIKRVDEIAKLLPQKSTADVMNLYNALSKELKKYKSDKNLRKKLLTFDDMPIAYEMSRLYVETEEKFASAIEKLDEAQFGSRQGEYRGKNYRGLVNRCKELFDLKHLESLLKIINTLNSPSKEATTGVAEASIFDLYDLVCDYIYELVSRLHIKKMNEMNLPQHFEWINFLKALKSPKNPKSMVNIINLKNPNKSVKEEIDYFDSSASDSAGSYSDTEDDDNNYLPSFSERELRMVENTDPKGIEISSRSDIWKLGVDKRDVYEVTREMLTEYNCSNKLWMQLTGQMKVLNKRKEPLDIKEEKLTTEDVSDKSDEDSGGDVAAVVSDSDSDTDLSQGESDSSDDETLQNPSILMNPESIDDIQSDSELLPFLYDADGNNAITEDEERSHSSDDVVGNMERLKWYDREFIVPDKVDIESAETPKIPMGLDLTTAGNEYYEKLCEEEEGRLDEKDIRDSIIHENLLLTRLTSSETSDDLNSKLYSDVLSQIDYGSKRLHGQSWKPEFGGAPLVFQSTRCHSNLHNLKKRAERNLARGSDGIDGNVSDLFRFTYNDY